jgi:hypothetical protein
LDILTAIPAGVRKWVYTGFAAAGVVLGAIDVALEPNPTWLDTSVKVLAYLGVALGITARANVAKERSLEDVADDNAALNDKTQFPYA